MLMQTVNQNQSNYEQKQVFVWQKSKVEFPLEQNK